MRGETQRASVLDRLYMQQLISESVEKVTCVVFKFERCRQWRAEWTEHATADFAVSSPYQRGPRTGQQIASAVIGCVAGYLHGTPLSNRFLVWISERCYQQHLQLCRIN
jgi:hypothetical protein